MRSPQTRSDMFGLPQRKRALARGDAQCVHLYTRATALMRPSPAGARPAGCAGSLRAAPGCRRSVANTRSSVARTSPARRRLRDQAIAMDAHEAFAEFVFQRLERFLDQHCAVGRNARRCTCPRRADNRSRRPARARGCRARARTDDAPCGLPSAYPSATARPHRRCSAARARARPAGAQGGWVSPDSRPHWRRTRPARARRSAVQKITAGA